MNHFAAKLLKKIAYLNYHSAKKHYLYQLKKRSGDDQRKPILIYQMGKVGSSTVKASLERYTNRKIYHFHVLQTEILKRLENFRKKSFPNISAGGIDYVWMSQYIRHWVTQDLKGEKWKIVTLVRDPLARSIATFFENSEVEKLDGDNSWRVKSAWHDFDIRVEEDDLGTLTEMYFKLIDRLLLRSLDYFDREFKGVMGVDLFDTPFSHSAGYQIYEYPKCNILLIKLEHLNECVQEAYRKFFKIDSTELDDQNVGSHKDYARLYQLVKERIKFPDRLIDEIYSHKLPMHFYSPEEIDSFRERWR